MPRRTRLGLDAAGDQIVKRMTYQTIAATGAGTTIPVTAFSSGQVESLPATEWASFAARYQQYRVHLIRVRGKAILPIQSATVSHSELFVGDFLGGVMPSSAAQVLSDERSKQFATHKDFNYVVTWARNPNAKLWNTTASAIPNADIFSAVFASPTVPVLTTATTYYSITVEWEVEFRGAQ